MSPLSRRLSLVVAAMLLVVSGVLAAQGAKIDVSGQWLFNVQTDAGTGEPTVTFKQEGEKLTGHYSSQTLGEADLTARSRAPPSSSLSSPMSRATRSDVNYNGTIDSNSADEGHAVDFGAVGRHVHREKK